MTLAPGTNSLYGFTGAQSGLILIERFDKGSDNVAGTGAQRLTLKNAAIVSTALGDDRLEVRSGAYAEIIAPERLRTTSGTITFWVKPLWNKGDGQSHTLLSMRWEGEKAGYLALSEGWWEPAGAGRLYFILNNQESVHCSTARRMEPGVWTMVTASWNSGPQGSCRLYLDGEKIAEQRKAFLGSLGPAGPLYVGSDRGATDRRGRRAEFLMDDLAVFDRALSDHEIFSTYANHRKGSSLAGEGKWGWLNEELTLPWEPHRDQEGRILESRVILDEDLHWAQSKDAVTTILDRVKAAGFNVYVPCVWHGNGTYYPTTLAHPEPKLAGLIASGYDPLAFLIEEAHRRGIEVHPWFTVVKRENESHPELYDDGTPEGAYNAHDPDFRRFIVDLMLDVVRRYDVDGINLDYIRTMGVCRSPACREDYQRVTGASFWPDYALRVVNGSARDRIQRWQDEAVTEIVVQFGVQARKIKPGLVISVDGHPHGRHVVRPLEGRDEVRWANEDLIDVVFNMDYRAVIDVQTADAVRSALTRPESMIVLFGNYDRRDGIAVPRDGTLVAKYAEFARRRWPSSGVAFYLYNLLSDEQIRALRQGPFREEALPSWPIPIPLDRVNGQHLKSAP